MDVISKAKILGDSGKYDVCGGEVCKPPEITTGLHNIPGIIRAKEKNGRFCSLLKTLQTNACKFDCNYCANRAGNRKSGNQKVSFTPVELSSLFNTLVQKNIVNGLFLSSGVSGDPDKSTADMLKTVRLVRHKYHFGGYIHFKVLPGTNYELVKQASELANRLSVNVEAPGSARLNELSSIKDFKNDILRRQAWIKRLRPGSGQTTQMIVGVNGETDLEVLRMARWEYEKMDLKRCYYSAFSPVKGTPFEDRRKETQLRANRLYKADWLFRVYKYEFRLLKEVMPDGMLPDKDPKVAIAEKTLAEPLELESAGFDELLMVPGIGPVTAENIIRKRESGARFDTKVLKRCGAVMQRAAPFIRVNGERQLRLNAL
ncbi:radical SAM protein [Candidatus Woesearchaeota archaeon]|nr:radical SAM protein [Candidatus Woesearchaeota archaeon]